MRDDLSEFFENIEIHKSFIDGWQYSKTFNLKMTKAQDLKDYYRTPKFALNQKYQSFFDEVYKLPSLEINAKIHKLTKGFNRLNQLIDMYNLYNSYAYFKSNWEQSLKAMNEDEFTLFKRKNDIVKFNDLVLITLRKNELVFESFEPFKYPNIEVYKRQTFSDILEQLIKSEYTKIQPQQPEPLDLSDSSGVEKTMFFENKFDNAEESEIFEYFKTHLVGKKYISEVLLKEYLKQAFELNDPPEKKFSFKNVDKKENIVNIFYTYYKNIVQSPHGKQPLYLNLLKNYFIGFEKINTRNFSTLYKKRRIQ